VSEVVVMAKKSKPVVDTTNTKIDEGELVVFSSSQFAKTDDLEDGETVKLLSPAYAMKTKYGMKRHIEVKAKRGTFLVRLNKISLTNLVRKYGSDSEKWVGGTAVVKKTTILGKDTIVFE
jgi:hypothetical protein